MDQFALFFGHQEGEIGLSDTLLVLDVSGAIEAVMQFGETATCEEDTRSSFCTAYSFLALAGTWPASKVSVSAPLDVAPVVLFFRSLASASCSSWSICSSEKGADAIADIVRTSPIEPRPHRELVC